LSLHYSIDLFGALTGPTPAPILDIIETPTGSSPLAGNFVVRVPEGLPVQKPLDLVDLITKKYAAFLAFYTTFTRVAYDDLLNTVDLDLAASGTAGMFGDRSAIRVNPAGLVQSQPVALVGGAPTQALITWETFTVTQTDDAAGTIARTYQEVPSDSAHVTCQVSFNNGASWLAALDGAVLNIPLVDRGTNFIIRLTNAFGTSLNIGSWALVY
jgi:hypothetical protein